MGIFDPIRVAGSSVSVPSGLAAIDQYKGFKDAIIAKETRDRLAKEEARQKIADERAAKEFKWKEDAVKKAEEEDAATKKYLSLVAGPAQQKAILTTNAGEMQNKYDNMSYSDAEQELLKGISLPTSEDGAAGLSALKSILASTTKATSDDLESIIRKTKEQQELSDIAGKMKPMYETQAEQSERAMKALKDAGMTPTKGILEDYKERRAADIELRKLTQTAAEKEAEAANKQIDKLKLKRSKAQSDIDGAKSASGKYLGKGETFNNVLYEAKKNVSWGGVAVPGSDAKGIDGINETLSKYGVSDDEKAYIIDNLIEPGFFGNSVPSGDELVKRTAQLRKEYAGGRATKSGYGELRELNRQIADQEAKYKTASDKVSAAGKTVDETRTEYVASMLDRIGATKPTTQTSNADAEQKVNVKLDQKKKEKKKEEVKPNAPLKESLTEFLKNETSNKPLEDALLRKLRASTAQGKADKNISPFAPAEVSIIGSYGLPMGKNINTAGLTQEQADFIKLLQNEQVKDANRKAIAANKILMQEDPGLVDTSATFIPTGKVLGKMVPKTTGPVQGPVNWRPSYMGTPTPSGGFGKGASTVKFKLDASPTATASRFLQKRLAETGSKGMPKATTMTPSDTITANTIGRIAKEVAEGKKVTKANVKFLTEDGNALLKRHPEYADVINDLLTAAAK